MRIAFEVSTDKHDKITFLTDAEGNDVIRASLLNKGSAFTKAERRTLKLEGYIPLRILSLDQQIKKLHKRYRGIGEIYAHLPADMPKQKRAELKQTLDILRFNFLRDLQDRNEILFYAFCHRYLKQVLPIIYTPTVGEAVKRFSRDTAHFRGVFLSPNNITSTEKIFDYFRFKKPSIAVVTDNQGILGLGDQGVGGIDIPIGKLSLYVLGAGIRPWETMPVTLDVGTDNKTILNDSYYLGYKNGRLDETAYEAFIDTFVHAIREKFPHILIQWEDFSRQKAFDLLDAYRHKILSFNDDIQGTGSVALAGVINAMKATGKSLADQQFIVYGAGAGGVGIARRLKSCLQTDYILSEQKATDKIILVDSRGMVTNQHDNKAYKKTFEKPYNFYKNWDVEDITYITLQEIIHNTSATILLGLSGCAHHFTSKIIKVMMRNCARPVIFPMSNPNTNAEAHPQTIYKETNGKALVATGSPYEPFQYHGKTIHIGQANNFYIFPGVGLGAILSRGSYIDDTVFTAAAHVLADLTDDALVQKGTLYPKIPDIRTISAHMAHATTEEIAREQQTKHFSLKEIQTLMWKPQYHPIQKK